MLQMKLSKIKLYNYRCFDDNEQIISIDDLTVFIGNNCTGKTAALTAINKIFAENPSDRNLQRSDFFLGKDISPEEVDEMEL